MKKDYRSAFKTYDIRSIYQEPVDEIFTYALGKALAEDLITKKWPEARICFGSDVRDPNNELIYYFLLWLEAGGLTNYIGVGMEADPIDEEQARAAKPEHASWSAFG